MTNQDSNQKRKPGRPAKNPAHESRVIESEEYHSRKDPVVQETWEEHHPDTRGKMKTVIKTRLANGNVYSKLKE